MAGHVVISKRGRDRGRPFVIVRWLRGDLVLIADGRHRMLAKPKVKKMKHLAFCGLCLSELREAFSGEGATDRQVRRVLAESRNLIVERCNALAEERVTVCPKMM
ncbi:MAG: KOW domain-containing RNA-binding protein [Clostridiales bacterium]|nr:KOW domain-containing RNA-binding protein [Clostridiales bacterium]